VSAFPWAQGDQSYNFRLLDEHKLAKGEIAGEQANNEAVAGMVAEDQGFLDEQWALYLFVSSICDPPRAMVSSRPTS
jgi:hypothetical protein